MNQKQGGSLAGRVRALVDRYWGGSVNRAARDLGVSQSLLHRVVTGELESPRTSVVEAFRRYLDVSADWLLAGIGPDPASVDSAGRPLVAGVPRWRRAIEQLELGPPIDREVMELPFGVWRAATTLRENAEDPFPDWLRDSLTLSLESWAEAVESLADEKGMSPMPVRIQRARACLRLAFAAEPTAMMQGKSRRRVEDLARSLDEH